MRQVFAILALTFAANAAGPCAAEGTLDSFAFEGTRIGDTLKEFQDRHPDAQMTTPPAALWGVPPLMRSAVKEYTAPSTKAHRAQYRFYRGRLYQIALDYDQATIERMGGIGPFLDRLRKIFGLTEDAKDYAAGRRTSFGPGSLWKGPDWRAILILTRDGYSLTVTDTAAEAAIESANAEKAKQIETGF